MSTTTAHKEPGRIPDLTLGWRLKMALDDMKAGDMADMLDVDRATVSRWMNDRGAPPRSIYIKQWALITGVDVRWLLTGETPHQDGPDEGIEVHRLGLEPRTHCLSGDQDGLADVIPLTRRMLPHRSSDPRHTGKPGTVIPFRGAAV